MTKKELKALGITERDIFDGDQALLSSCLCSLFNCAEPWVSCQRCPLYDDYGIAEQVLAILWGLAD